MAKSQGLEKLETGAIVTVITVLVWLYAEGENIVERQQRMSVRFVPPAGQDLAIVPQDPLEVVATVRGSTGEISALDDALIDGVRIEVAPQGNGAGSSQTIVLKDALSRSAVGGMGVNILDTDPPTKSVRVEQLVTRKFAVVAAPPKRLKLAGTPEFSPAEVSLRVPRSLADRYAGLTVAAHMDALDESEYDVNTSVTAQVPLELPSELRSPWTELERQTVQATFTIRKQTETTTLPTMRIRLNIDPLLLREYEIEPDSDVVLRDVRLSGPSDAIQAIVDGRTQVWAELRPTRDQVERGVTSLAPVVVAPPGVSSDPPEPVQVTIRRRVP